MNALWAVSVVNSMLCYKLKKTENYDQYNSRAGNSATDHLFTCLLLHRQHSDADTARPVGGI